MYLFIILFYKNVHSFCYACQFVGYELATCCMFTSPIDKHISKEAVKAKLKTNQANEVDKVVGSWEISSKRLGADAIADANKDGNDVYLDFVHFLESSDSMPSLVDANLWTVSMECVSI